MNNQRDSSQINKPQQRNNDNQNRNKDTPDADKRDDQFTVIDPRVNGSLRVTIQSSLIWQSRAGSFRRANQEEKVKQYSCCMCNQLVNIRKAKRCLQCKKVLCLAHFNEFTSSDSAIEQSCPTCFNGEMLPILDLDTETQNLNDGLSFKCNLKCNRIMNYSQLLDKNFHSDCPNVKIQCKLCQSVMKQNQKIYHSVHCLNQLVQCPLCTVRIPRNRRKIHLMRECQNLPQKNDTDGQNLLKMLLEQDSYTQQHRDDGFLDQNEEFKGTDFHNLKLKMQSPYKSVVQSVNKLTPNQMSNNNQKNMDANSDQKSLKRTSQEITRDHNICIDCEMRVTYSEDKLCQVCQNKKRQCREPNKISDLDQRSNQIGKNDTDLETENFFQTLQKTQNEKKDQRIKDLEQQVSQMKEGRFDMINKGIKCILCQNPDEEEELTHLSYCVKCVEKLAQNQDECLFVFPLNGNKCVLKCSIQIDDDQVLQIEQQGNNNINKGQRNQNIEKKNGDLETNCHDRAVEINQQKKRSITSSSSLCSLSDLSRQNDGNNEKQKASNPIHEDREALSKENSKQQLIQDSKSDARTERMYVSSRDQPGQRKNSGQEKEIRPLLQQQQSNNQRVYPGWFQPSNIRDLPFNKNKQNGKVDSGLSSESDEDLIEDDKNQNMIVQQKKSNPQQEMIQARNYSYQNPANNNTSNMASEFGQLNQRAAENNPIIRYGSNNLRAFGDLQNLNKDKEERERSAFEDLI
ncbi:UNKNOWN [Stylonychia lemnae]|uniref:Uncharacterized protein n=1 Tax=Stylonychia lemnae TaxID=5949 RepID=A0A078B891_STYLE|nr:UNKNOWN [Stylonychia lemnae]|eukprot:CDW90401.1 UNKNOWN [Stylonychia lemnae]